MMRYPYLGQLTSSSDHILVKLITNPKFNNVSHACGYGDSSSVYVSQEYNVEGMI